ncbi:MAG: 4-(cytidine 5'-diphospho)-2-C-methyl-D-erythritol kinase, partial [Gemmatimonadales bacterium]|nr:4-(cytidine 5'-diphospho)-2-C-methyl-D-erythritol kinase [Gemmatimonadales bacterium]
MTGSITVAAHAKANLFLRVLSRDTGGFHGIETLFCRLDLADTLVAERVPGREVSIEVQGDDTGPAEQNLAVRAARAAQGAIEGGIGVHLTLTKKIPIGAGLGGGSADAAAALHAVNALAGNPIPRAELFHLAARLGADVAFCATGASLALAWGHGERMMTLPGLPA